MARPDAGGGGSEVGSSLLLPPTFRAEATGGCWPRLLTSCQKGHTRPGATQGDGGIAPRYITPAHRSVNTVLTSVGRRVRATVTMRQRLPPDRRLPGGHLGPAQLTLSKSSELAFAQRQAPTYIARREGVRAR
jgi:hypothetical protein